MATLSLHLAAAAAAARVGLRNSLGCEPFANSRAPSLSAAGVRKVAGSRLTRAVSDVGAKRLRLRCAAMGDSEFEADLSSVSPSVEAEVMGFEAMDDVELEQGKESWLPLEKVMALSMAAFALAGGPALAREDITRFTPDQWINIYITTGICVVLYFLVIPIVIYNYLRLRWYKRSTLETFFQFLLVFLFFPGMLILAPFINFRRLPNDGADGP